MLKFLKMKVVAEDVTIMVEILAVDSAEEEILKAEKEEVQALALAASEVKEAQLLEEKVVSEAKEALPLEEKVVFLKEHQDVLKIPAMLQEQDAQEETNSLLLISG